MKILWSMFVHHHHHSFTPGTKTTRFSKKTFFLHSIMMMMMIMIQGKVFRLFFSWNSSIFYNGRTVLAWHLVLCCVVVKSICLPMILSLSLFFYIHLKLFFGSIHSIFVWFFSNKWESIVTHKQTNTIYTAQTTKPYTRHLS